MSVSLQRKYKLMYMHFSREYLATFKKTVAMHEMFLTRLAHHPVFRNDHNLRVFLEYDQDLCVRGKRYILLVIKHVIFSVVLR